MRRATSAALVLAALLALVASPSFHAHSAGKPGAPAVVAASGTIGFAAGAEPGAAPHDAALCPICRALAQARLALRAPAFAGSFVLASTSLPLHLAASEAPTPAPALQSGAPRAPPGPSAAAA